MQIEFQKTKAQLRESKRRQYEAAEAENDICRHCFQTDHRRSMCDQAKVVACSVCYKLNVFTTSCCESQNRREITDHSHQVFRFAGFPIPRMFIDVNILTKNIPALVCTGTIRSKIDHTLANFLRGFDAFTEPNWLLNGDGMDVPIRTKGNYTTLSCRIEHLEPNIHMILGMDYIMNRPFRCTFDNITLNSRALWTVPHHEHIDYVYNVPRGLQLRKHLRKHGYQLKSHSTQTTFEQERTWKQYFSRHEAKNHISQ